MRSGRKGPVQLAISLLLLLLVLASSFLLYGCGRTEKAATREEKTEKEERPEAEEPETVTLYFRRSIDSQEMLSPEERTVGGTADLYRAAMEELIKGPEPGSGLHAVLPDTVRVIDISAADGVCTVDLSAEVITDANQVGVSATGEGLALAAIANTLTEFDGITRVRLLIEGVQSGMVEGRFVEDFWGHVGLPEYLERNEDIVYR